RISELPKDLPELVKPALPFQPVGSTHRAFGKAATAFRIMHQHHGVSTRIKQQDVGAHRISFAHRSDLRRDCAYLCHNPLNRNCGAGRRVLLLLVMALDDAWHVSLSDRVGGDLCNLEEEIHSNGEVGSVKQTTFTALYVPANFLEMLVPACGPHDHASAISNASAHVFEHRFRIAEIDDYINVSQALRRERARVAVLRGSEDLNRVPPLARNFFHQRASLATAQQ